MKNARITEIIKQIEDLKKRWPAHSVPAVMMEQLDELEEELSREITKREQLDTNEEIRNLPPDP